MRTPDLGHPGRGRVFVSATASCTAGPPCCAATTWPSSSSGSARSASTPGGSTASSATPHVRGPRRVPAQRRASRRRHRGRGHACHELLRLQTRHHEPELVSAVRGPGRAAPRAPHPRGPPRGRRRRGGLGSVAGALRRRLRSPGPRSPSCTIPTTREQAHEANELGGRRLRRACASTPPGPRAPPLTGPAPTTSPRGAPAGRADPGARCPSASGVADGGVHGMSVPVLRETRMPAVVVELGPASTVVERRHLPLADALAVGPRPLGRRLRGDRITRVIRRRCRLRIRTPARVDSTSPPNVDATVATVKTQLPQVNRGDNPQRHAQVVEKLNRP